METRIEEVFEKGRFSELAFLYAPIGIVVTENRVIRDCNHAFSQMFGYDRDELKDNLFSMLYPSKEEFLNVREWGLERLKNTKSYWDERIMARRDGSLFWCRVRGHSFTPEEPLKHAVWTVADLSEIRPYKELTRRERQIVSYLADGMTSKEIAIQLDLSHRTVEVYRAKLLKKFGAANSNALFQALGHLKGDHVLPR